MNEGRMLGKSDRLRILCWVLDLDFEGFLKAFADQRGVEPVKMRESVHDWWRHIHQPTKLTGDILKALQRRADEKNRKWEVAVLWEEAATPWDFAKACGTVISSVLHVMSEVGRRTCTDPFNELPFVKLTLEDREANPAAIDQTLRQMSGSYFIYRMHSAERHLCKEPLRIAEKASAVSLRGKYKQYVGGGDERHIDLSLFSSNGSLHAIGAYRDKHSDNRRDASIIHATISKTPYREKLYRGLILGLTDDGSAVAAERILLEKLNAPHAASVQASVIRQPTKDEKTYDRFLNDQENDDRYFLLADHSLFRRKVESNPKKPRDSRRIEKRCVVAP